MKILSLDLSTKSSGWAVFENDNLIDYGCITSSSTDLIKRIQIMTNGIKEILEKYEINKIIAEEVRPQGGFGAGNIQTHRALMWLQAAIAFILYDNFKKLTLDFIYPSSWRESQKELDIQFVKEKFNIDVNDDIADAIGIGYAQVHTSEANYDWA